MAPDKQPETPEPTPASRVPPRTGVTASSRTAPTTATSPRPWRGSPAGPTGAGSGASPRRATSSSPRRPTTRARPPPPRAPGSAPPWPGTGASSSSPTTRCSSAPRTSGPSPASAGPRPPLTPPAELVRVPYGSHALAAYLRVPPRPAPGQAKAPAVIMVPGLDSTKEELQATAEFFLARGLATLAIDGPGQGEAEYELPIEPRYEKVATAAVDYLRGRDGHRRRTDRPVRREPRRLLRGPRGRLRAEAAGGRRPGRPVPA